jgi:hypothetical protein
VLGMHGASCRPLTVFVVLLVQGDAVLVEPLPALLSCVHHLSSTAQRSSTDAGRGPGSLGGSENWRGLIEDEEQQEQELSTSETLKVRLSRAAILLACVCSAILSLCKQHARSLPGAVHGNRRCGAEPVVLSRSARLLCV